MISLAANSVTSIITVINSSLIYRADIHKDYMDGLKVLSFEKMSYELKLLKKIFYNELVI